MLLRPKTGLKDMFVELDPGTQAAGELPEGGRIALAQTRPDVNPDEILAQLDGDTRAYLHDPRQRRRRGVHGRPDPAVRAVLRGRPARDVQAVRADERVRREVHRPPVRAARERAARDPQLQPARRRSWARRTRSSPSWSSPRTRTSRSFAEQEANLRRSLQLLPQTLSTDRDGRSAKVETLAGELGPSFEALRPFARNLGPALRRGAARPARDHADHPRRDPAVHARSRAARSRELRAAAEELAPTTSRLNSAFGVVNDLLNTLAYNPPGDEEGYLFWTAWANHAAAFVFNTQDAHGPIRRGNFLVDCASLAAVEALVRGLPQLELLFELLNAPDSDEVCAQAADPERTARTRRDPEAETAKAASGGFD